MKCFLLLWVALASRGATASEIASRSVGGLRRSDLPTDTLEGAQNASIVISWPAESKRYYRSCDAAKCKVNLADPANQAQPAPGILARVAEALKPYFTHVESATKFVAAESRGAESDLAEAVLLVHAGQVDVASPLSSRAWNPPAAL